MRFAIVYDGMIHGIGKEPELAWRNAAESLETSSAEYRGASCKQCSDRMAMLFWDFGGNSYSVEKGGVLFTELEAMEHED